MQYLYGHKFHPEAIHFHGDIRFVCCKATASYLTRVQRSLCDVRATGRRPGNEATTDVCGLHSQAAGSHIAYGFPH